MNDDKKFTQEYLDVRLELKGLRTDVDNCKARVDGMSTRVRKSNGAIHDSALYKEWRGSFFSNMIIVIGSVATILSIAWLLTKLGWL